MRRGEIGKLSKHVQRVSMLLACILVFEVYPARAQTAPGVLTVDAEHTREPDRVAISPDGRFGASIAFDQQLKIWDVVERRQLWTFSMLDIWSGLAFRPNSTVLAVGQRSGTVALLDYRVGSLSTLRCDKEDNQGAVTAVSFSANGRYLACGDLRSGTIGVIDLEDDNDHSLRLYASQDIDGSANNIAFSQDGLHLAVAFFTGELVVYDLDQHRETRPCKLPGFHAQAVAFTPANHVIAAGDVPNGKSPDLILYDCTRQRKIDRVKKCVSPLPGYTSFSQNGTYFGISAMVQGQPRVKVWHFPDASPRDASIEKSYPIGPIQINDSGQALFIDALNAVYFLPDRNTVLRFDSSPVQRIGSLRFLDNGDLFVGRDRTASLWDFATGERRAFRISNAIYSLDNSRMVYKGGNHYLQFVDNKLHKNFNTQLQLPVVSMMDISHDGKYAAWTESQDNHRIAKFISLDNAHPTPITICQEQNLAQMGFFSGQDLLVTPCGVGADVDFQIRDASRPQQLLHHIPFREQVIAYCLSKRSSALAISTSTKVMLYDLLSESPRPRVLAEGAPYSRRVVGFSEDDKILATSIRKDDFSFLELWDIGSNLNVSIPMDAEVISITFGKKTLAAGLLNGTIAILDLQDKKRLFMLLDCGSSDWLTISPGGQFDGTAAALRWVGWRKDNLIRPFESYFATFYTPGLLLDLLQKLELQTTPAGAKAPVDLAPDAESTVRDRRMVTPGDKTAIQLLSIGVGKYGANSGFQPLDYSILDATAVGDSFESALPWVHTKELHDDFATRDKILEEFRTFETYSRPEDIIILYFSGHGYVPPGSEMFYFEPYDAKGLTLDDQRKSAISTADLADLLRNASAQRVLLIVDSCQSGEALESLAKLADIKQRVEQVKFRLGRVSSPVTGVHILFAATPSEKAFSSSDYQHSLLTEAVIEGLSDPSNSHVSARTLIEYVQHRLPEMVKRSGVQQTPLFESVGADIQLWEALKK